MCNYCQHLYPPIDKDLHNLMPGDRVMVFDHRLYVDDFKTPFSMTVRPATIIARYGKKLNNEFTGNKDWIYPDLLDVEFDHRPGEVSKGHFTDGAKRVVK